MTIYPYTGYSENLANGGLVSLSDEYFLAMPEQSNTWNKCEASSNTQCPDITGRCTADEASSCGYRLLNKASSRPETDSAQSDTKGFRFVVISDGGDGTTLEGDSTTLPGTSSGGALYNQNYVPYGWSMYVWCDNKYMVD